MYPSVKLHLTENKTFLKDVFSDNLFVCPSALNFVVNCDSFSCLLKVTSARCNTFFKTFNSLFQKCLIIQKPEQIDSTVRWHGSKSSKSFILADLHLSYLLLVCHVISPYVRFPEYLEKLLTGFIVKFFMLGYNH